MGALSEHIIGSKEKPVIQIQLTDPETFHLAIAINTPTVDMALNMLQQTIRVVEAERRKQEALDLHAQLQNEAMNNAVAAQIRRPS